MNKLPIIFLLSVSAIALQAQTKLFPLLKTSGPVFDAPYAEEKPDPLQEYKIIVSIGDDIEKAGELHPSLFTFARMYNLHVYGGVPLEKLQFVLIFFFKATPAVLNNDAYKAKYNVDNPNLVLIEELKKAGVKVLVCSQSIELLKLNYREVSSGVKIATSRFTTVSSHMLKGYAAFTL